MLHEEKKLQSFLEQSCTVYTKDIFLAEYHFNSKYRHTLKSVECGASSTLFPHPFTWHVYSISTCYVSLTAYIRVHSAASERRTRHSVIWQAELKRCQHIHPGRDEFQQLTDHFVTVMERHAHILCPRTSHHTDTHTHEAVSCNICYWA